MSNPIKSLFLDVGRSFPTTSSRLIAGRKASKMAKVTVAQLEVEITELREEVMVLKHLLENQLGEISRLSERLNLLSGGPKVEPVGSEPLRAPTQVSKGNYATKGVPPSPGQWARAKTMGIDITGLDRSAAWEALRGR